MNLKNYKNLMSFVLEAKVILKKMVQKNIYFFSQYANIFKKLQVLVVVIIYTFGNP